MDTPELPNSVAAISTTLADMRATGLAIAEGLTQIDDDLSLLRRSAFPPPKLRDAGSWPWAPGTTTQGFLGARWNRRDGNVYGDAALRGVQAANSPIRGGDDAGAIVDVPSGARRSSREGVAHHAESQNRGT